MPLDAYSVCPGGTGKKIKFCCGDFVGELEKIDRMVEGQQHLACLKHIDRLLEQEPGCERPCLLATKCKLLRATDQRQAARATAAAFLAKHPDNQVALAELAMLAAANNARTALGLLQRAIRAAKGVLSAPVYQAMGVTAEALLREGYPLPARALLDMQCDLFDEDDRPASLLSALSQATDVPLLLRDDQPLVPCPDGVAWKERFAEAAHAVALGDWQAAADRLTELASEVPDAPAIWRNLATVRGCLADNAGCIEALRKYAALRAGEEDGLDDAVEAEAEAMFLSDDPLGDRLNMFKLSWTVKDVERLQEALASSPRFRPVPFDPAHFSDGQTPPPKAAYMVLDRPMPDSAEGLCLETTPRLLGQVLLFGRQTDCDAHLDVLDVAGDESQTVIGLVREAAGEAVNPQAKQEVVDHWSASQRLLRTVLLPPRGTLPEQFRAIMEEHQREAILNRWPDLTLRILEGHSPREVAGNAGQVAHLQTYRLRLLAAILVLEHWSERSLARVDLNELRTRLGLPLPEAIDPRQHSVDDLPTTRLWRLSVEGLSDEQLIDAYHRADEFVVRPALRRFAEAIVHRPSLVDSEQRLSAYAALARNEEDSTRALEYLDQGRRAGEAKKISGGLWDLMELPIRFARREAAEISRLIEHIEKHHINEPGVGHALARLLVEVGLLRPDGTPAINPGAPESAMAAEEPAAEPTKLWTPDSVQPGGGKLWTPE